MKKWMNTIFFGICFITAVLHLLYCILLLDGDMISSTALGIVVLITGYLFMDSIRSAFKKSNENARFYVDHIMGEEMEKRNERYTQLMNLQKAVYSATKKNTAYMAEQFEALSARLDALESNLDNAERRITELQKKALEGQKNALNYELSYIKENTKHLIGYMKNLDAPLKNREEELVKEENNAPETNPPRKDESISEADNQTANMDNNNTIAPLYDDPNKKLTAEEIATLFDSYGK